MTNNSNTLHLNLFYDMTNNSNTLNLNPFPLCAGSIKRLKK